MRNVCNSSEVWNSKWREQICSCNDVCIYAYVHLDTKAVVFAPAAAQTNEPRLQKMANKSNTLKLHIHTHVAYISIYVHIYSYTCKCHMLSFVHAAAYSLESFREKAAANRVKTFSVGEWAKSIIMIAITHAKLLQVNRNVSKCQCIFKLYKFFF